MARIFNFQISMIVVSTLLGFTFPAAAVDARMVASQNAAACLVGLGAGDGAPAWSQLDVTPNRSVDIDLVDGAGLTVACGVFVSGVGQPAKVAAPAASPDPSTKGDFGSL